jgi:hypothetical protein
MKLILSIVEAHSSYVTILLAGNKTIFKTA